jgi:hypothetical protein
MRMNESIQVWTPLYDRAVALFVETVEGETPSFQRRESAELVRGKDGQPIVVGGWPCRRFPSNWRARAEEVLDAYREARARNRLCGKPERPKEHFARLRGHLSTCATDPGKLTGRDVGMIRKIIAAYEARHGAPGSTRLLTTRAIQSRDAARAPHDAIARVVAERLERYPRDEGVPDLPDALVPISDEEASRSCIPANERLPAPIVAKTMRCLEAPIQVLIEKGLVPSGEVMAQVLPALTARVQAASIGDADLRRVYEAVYQAFRRRRSLLLLDLASQVKISELPWIAAVEPWIRSGQTSREGVRATLVQAATLAISTFPHTIIPNKLLKELRSLAGGAGVPLPLVDELAADIFVGAFSESFLRAAKVSARMLGGTLYERYYGLPYDRVSCIDDVERARFGTPSSPAFASLCEELAGPQAGGSPTARNGAIIEQAQILTTHNLAVLFDALGLAASLQLLDLARRCFTWICRRQQMKISAWGPQLQMMKNTAYAWRQMVFYLSLASPEEVETFAEWSAGHLQEQEATFRQRFEPVMAGLRSVIAGDRFASGGVHAGSGGRRFLGWSMGRHWLFPPADHRGSHRG